jgi:hypothetical protein
MWDNRRDSQVKRQGRGDSRESKSEQRRFLDGTTPRPGNLQKRQDTMPDSSPSLGGPSGWQVAMSEQILANREGDPNVGVGGDWMTQLKADSVQFLDDQKGGTAQNVTKVSIYKKGIEILVDKVFNLLQRYMYEFNKVAAGTDLHVSGSISGDITEVTRFNKFREAEETQTYFRARFSTRHYSLVLRGKDTTIDFFLLPVARSMALSRGENEYTPLATIQMKITEDGMMWRMKDGVPPVDGLESLAMWLFQQLVQQTKQATEAMKSS